MSTARRPSGTTTAVETSWLGSHMIASASAAFIFFFSR